MSNSAPNDEFHVWFQRLHRLATTAAKQRGRGL